jgi:hypothetical protein
MIKRIITLMNYEKAKEACLKAFKEKTTWEDRTTVWPLVYKNYTDAVKNCIGNCCFTARIAEESNQMLMWYINHSF